MSKLDYKWWVIFILAGILIFKIMCQKTNVVDAHKVENNKIKKQNEILMKRNDSIDKENAVLDLRIAKSEALIKNGMAEIESLQVEINKMEYRRKQVNIKNLNADQVVKELNDYIKQKRKDDRK